VTAIGAVAALYITMSFWDRNRKATAQSNDSSNDRIQKSGESTNAVGPSDDKSNETIRTFTQNKSEANGKANENHSNEKLKGAVSDPYRSPFYDHIGNDFDEYFKLSPFTGHNVIVKTPDVMVHSAVNHTAGGWKFVPGLTFSLKSGDNPSRQLLSATFETIGNDLDKEKLNNNSNHLANSQRLSTMTISFMEAER